MVLSFRILNSFLLPVLIGFFIENLPAVPYSLDLWWWNFFQLSVVVLKAAFYGATLGVFIEMVSAENYLCSFARLRNNALNLGGLWIILQTLRLSILHCLPVESLEKGYVPLLLVDGLLIICLAVGGTLIKYHHLVQAKKSLFNIKFIGQILALVGIYVLAVSALQISVRDLPVFLKPVEKLALVYVYFLFFICLVDRTISFLPQIRKEFSSSKELLLINPPAGGVLQNFASLMLRSYPAVFLVLKAFTPSGYRIREFDRVIWRRHYYKSNALVAITCYTTNSPEAYKMAKEFKKKGSTVIMGGPHVTYLPQEALAFCDSVIIGSAEGVWEKVIHDYEQGQLQKTYFGFSHEEHYEKLQQFLLQQPYQHIRNFLETTRGCKFKCDFCTIPLVGDKKYYLKPVQQMVELIEKIPVHKRKFEFLDANIYSDPSYAKIFFEALKPLKTTWHAQTSIDIACNEETLKAAAKSGCRGLLIGYEISSDSPEKNQGGKFAMAQRFLEFSRNIKKEGISIKGHFIFGFHSDNFKSILRLWSFAFRIRPNVTALFLLTPTPGSQLYFQMLKKREILTLNWRRYNYWNMVWRHPTMNTALVNALYPFFYVVFFLATSTRGFLMVMTLIVFGILGVPLLAHKDLWNIIVFLF